MLIRLRWRLLRAALSAILLFWWSTGPAFAHDGPAGSDFLMLDWMDFTFLLFFFAALLMFVVARRRGLLSNLEDAKYHILTIKEPDYYTPPWAKEEPDAAER